MAKTRTDIPKTVSDGVLREYNHRCARCGTDRPQLHHIDEDPSNNDKLNLIPLCPNCHLTNQHNPTSAIDPGVLRFFRQHKDPAILKPQFYPLFKRMKFMDDVQGDTNVEVLNAQAAELTSFVKMLEMGEFYSQRISSLICPVGFLIPPFLVHTGKLSQAEEHRIQVENADRHQKYRDKVTSGRGGVHELVAELLHFQKW